MPGVGAELGVVVAYGRIIPVAVLDRLPMVNLHFSLLPRWRGAAPVERAILEGDAETGVCLMAVEAGLDTGGIYAELDTGIGEEETADELRARLVAIGCRLLAEHLGDGLAGLPVARDQVGRAVLRREDPRRRARAASGTSPAIQIRRVIRLGRAWTTFRGGGCSILRATGVRPGSVRAAPGSRRAPSTGAEVVAGDGTRVRLVTVQPEGKRPMDADDWLRGVRPRPGERLGA